MWRGANFETFNFHLCNPHTYKIMIFNMINTKMSPQVCTLYTLTFLSYKRHVTNSLGHSNYINSFLASSNWLIKETAMFLIWTFRYVLVDPWWEKERVNLNGCNIIYVDHYLHFTLKIPNCLFGNINGFIDSRLILIMLIMT